MDRWRDQVAESSASAGPAGRRARPVIKRITLRHPAPATCPRGSSRRPGSQATAGGRRGRAGRRPTVAGRGLHDPARPRRSRRPGTTAIGHRVVRRRRLPGRATTTGSTRPRRAACGGPTALVEPTSARWSWPRRWWCAAPTGSSAVARGGAKLKHMALARRAAGLSPAEFSRAVAEPRRPGRPGGERRPVTAIPDEACGVAPTCRTTRRPRPAGEWAYDAVNEVYFDDLEGLRTADPLVRGQPSPASRRGGAVPAVVVPRRPRDTSCSHRT